jgi:methylated-DNA-[protein]-cysteine S-methyltransferase
MMPERFLVFPTQLGWIGLIAAGSTVRRVTFGHPTAAAAERALQNAAKLPVRRRGILPRCALEGRGKMPPCIPAGRGKMPRLLHSLVRRLQDYADGAPENFRDVRVDPGPLSQFQRLVLEACRRVPYGATVSYAELATRAGYPGAARAVGNCMAANRIPLITPCHRVVCSDGRLGAFSAPGGTAMKRRLLALESLTGPAK